MTAINYKVLQCTDGGKHKIEDCLYANNPSPFVGQDTTLKREDWQCCTIKVNTAVDVVVSYQKKYSHQEAYKLDFPVQMAQIVCVLALLCFASCVVENSGTMQEFKDLQLQQDSLPWLQKLQDKQVRCLYSYWFNFPTT